MVFERYFTIAKGNHYSNKRFPFFFLFWGNKLNFSFRFTNNVKFKLSSKEAQKDTNKIFGISDSWKHHNNSIRIGWRYNIDKKLIELLVYYYIDGIHNTYVIDSLPSYWKQNNCSIEIRKDKYLIKVNGKGLILNRKSKWNFGRYLLFPYFGGKSVAPNNVLLKIKWGFENE